MLPSETLPRHVSREAQGSPTVAQGHFPPPTASSMAWQTGPHDAGGQGVLSARGAMAEPVRQFPQPSTEPWSQWPLPEAALPEDASGPGTGNSPAGPGAPPGQSRPPAGPRGGRHGGQGVRAEGKDGPPPLCARAAWTCLLLSPTPRNLPLPHAKTTPAPSPRTGPTPSRMPTRARAGSSPPRTFLESSLSSVSMTSLLPPASLQPARRSPGWIEKAPRGAALAALSLWRPRRVRWGGGGRRAPAPF